MKILNGRAECRKLNKNSTEVQQEIGIIIE